MSGHTHTTTDPTNGRHVTQPLAAKAASVAQPASLGAEIRSKACPMLQGHSQSPVALKMVWEFLYMSLRQAGQARDRPSPRQKDCLTGPTAP